MVSAPSKNVGQQTTEAPPVVGVTEGVTASESQDRDDPVMGHPKTPKLEDSRLLELIVALKHIAGLQRAASNAQINARQKRREIGFLQHDVGNRDASFMKEVQKLIAQGRLNGFDELLLLATKCQDARDQLGPVEGGRLEAEQRWEGHLWRLQQAEEKLYEDFFPEFQIAESYPTKPASLASRSGDSSAASSVASNSLSTEFFPMRVASGENQQSWTREQQEIAEITTPNINFFPSYARSASSASSFLFSAPPTPPAIEMPQSMMLTAVGTQEPLGDTTSSCYESFTADIDRMPATPPGDHMTDPQQALPADHPQGPDLYAELRTDFKNKRDMMNKWIKQITLESHVHSTLLYDILQKTLEEEEKEIKPSNWSQLVIAYWNTDDAALPHKQQKLGHDNRTDDSLTQIQATAVEPFHHAASTHGPFDGRTDRIVTKIRTGGPEFSHRPARSTRDSLLSPEIPSFRSSRVTIQRSVSDSTSRTHRKANSWSENSSITTSPFSDQIWPGRGRQQLPPDPG